MFISATSRSYIQMSSRWTQLALATPVGKPQMMLGQSILMSWFHPTWRVQPLLCGTLSKTCTWSSSWCTTVSHSNWPTWQHLVGITVSHSNWSTWQHLVGITVSHSYWPTWQHLVGFQQSLTGVSLSLIDDWDLTPSQAWRSQVNVWSAVYWTWHCVWREIR